MQAGEAEEQRGWLAVGWRVGLGWFAAVLRLSPFPWLPNHWVEAPLHLGPGLSISFSPSSNSLHPQFPQTRQRLWSLLTATP